MHSVITLLTKAARFIARHRLSEFRALKRKFGCFGHAFKQEIEVNVRQIYRDPIPIEWGMDCNAATPQKNLRFKD